MSSAEKDSNKLRVIAIPVAGGRLCMHFGHCEQFALLDVDMESKEILNSRQISLRFISRACFHDGCTNRG